VADATENNRTLSIRVEGAPGSDAARAASDAANRLRDVLAALNVAVEVELVDGAPLAHRAGPRRRTAADGRVLVAGQPLDAWLPVLTVEAGPDGELIAPDTDTTPITADGIVEAGLRAASDLLDVAAAPADCPGTHCGRCCGGRCAHRA
jgi:hypothetical protein